MGWEGTAAVGSQVVYGFYKNRQRQQFIPCICIQNDTVAWDDSVNTGQMSLNGFLIECLSNRQVFFISSVTG